MRRKPIFGQSLALCQSTNTITGLPCRHTVRPGERFCAEHRHQRAASPAPPSLFAPTVEPPSIPFAPPAAGAGAASLFQSAQQGDHNALRMLVRRRDATPDMLGWAAAHGDVTIRSAVARHANCTPDLRASLAGQANPTVNNALLSSPHTETALVQRLAQTDQSVESRVQAAGHPACPSQMLQQALHDQSPRVRAAAASNPRLPTAYLHAMTQSELDPYVQQVARDMLTIRSGDFEFLNA